MEAIIKTYTFGLMQNVFITDPKSSTGFTSFKMLLEQIPDFLMKIDNLTDVHIFGNETFIKPIVTKIKDKEYIKYNNNSINIILNK